MGIPIKPEPEPVGDGCWQCFDPGKTPAIMHVIFSGIKGGELKDETFPSPPNGHFKLTQDPERPCTWHYRNALWRIDYSVKTTFWPEQGSYLWASIVDPLFVYGFVKHYKDNCYDRFSNGKQSWDFNHYYGGAGWCFSLI